jgi:hypothetical protein
MQCLLMFPLFSWKIYMSHRIYRGAKVYLIKSPHLCLCMGPPSGHVSPLSYDRIVFKLQAFSW